MAMPRESNTPTLVLSFSPVLVTITQFSLGKSQMKLHLGLIRFTHGPNSPQSKRRQFYP